MKEWINNECSEYMFLHLNIRVWFTRSHASKGENRARNRSKSCMCKQALRERVIFFPQDVLHNDLTVKENEDRLQVKWKHEILFSDSKRSISLRNSGVTFSFAPDIGYEFLRIA